jgi:hypothetical protein
MTVRDDSPSHFLRFASFLPLPGVCLLYTLGEGELIHSWPRCGDPSRSCDQWSVPSPLPQRKAHLGSALTPQGSSRRRSDKGGASRRAPIMPNGAGKPSELSRLLWPQGGNGLVQSYTRGRPNSGSWLLRVMRFTAHQKARFAEAIPGALQRRATDSGKGKEQGNKLFVRITKSPPSHNAYLDNVIVSGC